MAKQLVTEYRPVLCLGEENVQAAISDITSETDGSQWKVHSITPSGWQTSIRGGALSLQGQEELHIRFIVLFERNYLANVS